MRSPREPMSDVADALSEFDGATAPLLRSISYLSEVLRNDDHAGDLWHKHMTAPAAELPPDPVAVHMLLQEFERHLNTFRHRLEELTTGGTA